MANCESDLFRARLSQNLWEEGGGCAPERRHAELFRRFLRDGLGLPAGDPEFEAATHYFVNAYLAYCLQREPVATSAFLSLGTESIVPRMYELFIAALLRAGVPDDQLGFFRLHVECDDDHARTLEELMRSYASEPRWNEICRGAMLHALDLRQQFFERLVDGLERRRLAPLLARVGACVSLCGPDPAAGAVRHRAGDPTPRLYTNTVTRDGIEFTVDRIPLAAEVLDPRHVVIPAGRRNERHRHAHETFIHILAGAGRVHVEALVVDVAAGDSVLVPRWAVHHTENTGGGPLRFLAVTDYHFTRRAFAGDARAYRLDEAANLHRLE